MSTNMRYAFFTKHMDSIRNFYIDSVKGRPSAEVFHAVGCLYAHLDRHLADYLNPLGLTPVKFNTLMLIKHHGQASGLSQNEISHHLIVSPSNTTRLLNRLIKDGFVKRTAAKDDKRVNFITITPKGSLALDRVWHGYGDLIHKTVYVLNRPQVEDLSKLLLQWFNELSKLSKKSDFNRNSRKKDHLMKNNKGEGHENKEF